MTSRGGPCALARGSLVVLAVLAPVRFARDVESKVALPPPLEVEFSGCGAVTEGPVCELPEGGALRVWVHAAEGARVAVTIDGREIEAAAAPVQVGSLFRLQVGLDARELAVTARHGGARAVFRLPLRPPSAVPVVKQAEALLKQGKLDESAALLTTPAVNGDERVRAAATGALARVHRTQGRIDDALVELESAAAQHRAIGRVSDALRDELALAFTLIYDRRQFPAARRALDRSRQLSGYADGRARATYYEGLIAYETGDFRSALRLLRESARQSERLALDTHRVAALQVEANILLTLGREAEGEARIREAEPLAAALATPCERADFLTNAGWFALHMRPQADVGGALRGRAAALLAEALPLYRSACSNPSATSNALANMALLELRQGHLESAQRYLDEARQELAEPDARSLAFWIDIEAEISLRSGQPKAALSSYEVLSQLAAGALLPGARWRAALGRAQALEALGRDAEAGAAYAEAEALLEDHSLLVPPDEGRTTFLGHSEESSRLRVDFLMRRAPAEAAAAARRARARSLAALQWFDRLGTLSADERARWEETVSAYRRERAALEAEADDWKLSTLELPAARARREDRERRLAEQLDDAFAALGHLDTTNAELAAPADGELFLVYYPIRSGWAGFALTRDGVTARALHGVHPRGSPADLARDLLYPFADAIAAAKRVRFIPSGELARIDFHALPWNGGRLLSALPVAYGVDLPRRARSPDARPPAAEARALVVADPRGDLRGAREEARAVSTALEQQQAWSVQRLEGAEATHRAVLDSIETGAPALLHYAGHGVFGGLGGWESGLPVAGGGALTVSDILMLSRAPDRVVLSGCETARTADGAHVEGLGLAQAFLVAGASAVVATTRTVEDHFAARIMGAFYAPPSAGHGGGEQCPPAAPALDDAPDRLRAAQLGAMRDAPASDWASFRVLVP